MSSGSNPFALKTVGHVEGQEYPFDTVEFALPDQHSQGGNEVATFMNGLDIQGVQNAEWS